MNDQLQLLLQGFATALQPEYLLYALIGVMVGTAVGVLPGIGPAMTVALLLPLTYTLDPTAAIIMFAGIYYGGMYGGSTTSILLNTPGESASIVTAIDGHAMAKAGRASAALATAAIGSFIAGTIATVGLTVLAPTISQYATQLRPNDMFAIMVVAFVTVGALLGSSPIRGLVSLAAGLFIALIGTDGQTGQERYTLGMDQLGEGVGVVLAAVGLFAVGESLYVASRLRRGAIDVIPVTGRWNSWMTKSEFSRSWRPWLRGSLIGFPIGTVPGGGADVATFVSYATERQLSKRKDEFGKGAIEGVAGPEAANNAAAGGVMVPLLTLGIPTTATAAMIIFALQSQGIRPGPQLMDEQAPLVWALLASLYVANVVLVILNLPLVGIWVKLLQIPRPYLYAGILTFAVFGVFASNPDTFQVVLLLLVGVLGFFMRRYGYPIGPFVVGMILGPMAEDELRQSMAISQGDPGFLVHTWFSVGAYAILFVLVAVGIVMKLRERRLNQIVAAAVDPQRAVSEQSIDPRERSLR